MEAFRGLSNVDVFILFPHGRVSDVQRRQMTTPVEANVHALAMDGDFDDCQARVKDMFNDFDFRDGVRLAGVNSINWARVLAQVVYYFSSAVSLGAPHRAVSFTVPTGNFGDIFAGYIARSMGLPIDKLVIATHSDQALSLLAEPSQAERATLGAIRYHHNRAVLHTDSRMLPSRRAAWAAWNYESTPAGGAVRAEDNQVCLHYLINMLQPVPWQQPVVVSLNPLRPIRPDSILGEFDYAHPVFDTAAIRAQGMMAELQGRGDTFFAGAWLGYGFHEDGIKSGQAAARLLLESRHAAPLAEALA
jgi:hypothetical protein